MITQKSNAKHRFRLKTGLLPCFIFLFALIACGDDKPGSKDNPYDKPHRPSSPVVVSEIGPTSGGLGTKVVVSGENFGNDPEKITLWFNDKKALILKAQDNAIYAMVPKQPGEFSTIKVEVEGQEGVLDDVLFRYYIRETVTTIAGVWDVIGADDGPALESTFSRPAKVAVNDNNDVLISDDNGQRIRLYNAQENKVTTVYLGVAWCSTMNAQFSHFYACARTAAQRPLLFFGLSKESAYLESESYFDQNGIFGSYDMHGIAADDTYVYCLSVNSTRLVRVHQVSKTVELMGENLALGTVVYLLYSKRDGMIYTSSESGRQICRFDPYHTPEGRTTPWITFQDVEVLAGTGIAPTSGIKEGQGREAQFGGVTSIAGDMDGNLYFADYTYHVIWKIDPLFNCTVLAGTAGVNGYRDGKPSEAIFNRPIGVACTDDGLIYVADGNNRLVRCISIQ